MPWKRKLPALSNVVALSNFVRETEHILSKLQPHIERRGGYALPEGRGRLELRSNWQLYVEEFAQAVEVVTGQKASVAPLHPNGDYLTPFEAKYDQSGQTLWRLCIDLERP